MKTKQLFHALFVAVGLMGGVFIPLDIVQAASYFATTAEATKAAEKIGYRRTVYEATKSAKVKGLQYITPDVDNHKGGAWKAAKTVAGLGSKQTRLGTYNENLTVRIGD
ncbi:toxin C-terminal domain-containing protein [Neisseria sp. 83E34]|uniref:toxin C-terminal domain-containing protein n=1 Tax=Neisseria sp. 83E34 TaxID=1692264 RepID=UPI0006CE9CC0|nr:toxin C-terminal domain-containing protein [Neisseria sp. 83E34]